jgi:hypothetical protein
MKHFSKLIGLLIILLVAWYAVGVKQKGYFKNNLPQPIDERNNSDKLLTKKFFYQKKIDLIPLVTPDNFELNQQYLNQLQKLSAILFDSLHLTIESMESMHQTSLKEVDASTIIQLQVFNSIQQNDISKAEVLLVMGLLLEKQNETTYFVEQYLMKQGLWKNSIRTVHVLLMKQPNNKHMNDAFLALLAPANTKQVLEYLMDVQFLDRGPTDEYYSVNPHVLDRFNEQLLHEILDKVNDYSWYAAYPERDAEQAILQILETK